MILDVPLIFQPQDSVKCGVACIEMIMRYHNREAADESILKDVAIFKDGIWPAQIGTYFLQKGFGVEMQVFNPSVFVEGHAQLPQGNISDIISKYDPDKEKGSAWKKEEELSKGFILQFMRNGGIVNPKVPSIKDISDEIDASHPIFANMTTRWRCGYPAKFNSHFNVITGYDWRSIYTNDPGASGFGGKKEYAHYEFLFALYALSADLGNGSILKIRPN